MLRSIRYCLSLVLLAMTALSVCALRTNPSRFVGHHRRSLMELFEQKGVVTMYKKEGCPYCQKAKALLEDTYELNIKFVDIESDQRDDILNQMRQFSGGRNTVPQIFFNSEHLGGNDDVQKLHADGVLKNKVEVVKSTPVTMMMDHWFHPWY